MTLGRGFETPSSFIRDRRLTNVPTLIVLRDGLEIGRVVETSATETMVTDLAEILRERPLHHTGRWKRESRIAAGRYRYLDPSGAERGTEDWELYGLENGGSLLHAWIDLDDGNGFTHVCRGLYKDGDIEDRREMYEGTRHDAKYATHQYNEI